MTMQNPLFGRGAYDSASVNSQSAGCEREFEDLDYDDVKRGRRTNHIVRCRWVKNSSGIALLPGYLVVFKAGTNRTEVDGYARLTAADAVVADEWLPAAGVPNGSYFWVVVHGPTVCITDPAAGANNLLPEDTVLVALTAAASTVSTTAGRIAPQDLTGATAVLGGQIQNALGRAMSAKTTANSNAEILMFFSKRWD
jgi:hypothetical protein